MNKYPETQELITDIVQLLDFFHKGVKPASEFKVGIEIEKAGISSSTLEAVSYSGENGIQEFLKKYKQVKNWNYIKENNNIIGLVDGCDSITLEPGSQIELSNCPKKTIHGINEQISNYNTFTANLAEEFDIYWLGYGIQPLSTYNNIHVIPKRRYEIMTEYLLDKGEKAYVMMRETAGIQCAVDYASEEDLINKLKISLALSPIVTAMFANSPVRNGRETGYKSYRASAWLKTDDDRCGLVSKKVFDNAFDIIEYVNLLLDLPMIFLRKGEEWINMSGMTFRDYIKNGYNGYKATMEDWALHRNSYFPDVRVNGYLEIRNTDAQRSDLIPAVPALWKGIMYNNAAMEAAWELVKDFSWKDMLELREIVPKEGLSATKENIKVVDLAKELVHIADYSLKSMAQLNENNQDESIYLDRVKELLAKNRSPADEIIKFWNGKWNGDLKNLIEYVRLN